MNTLKIKINYALIVLLIVGVTFLTLYYHMGDAYDAFRYTLLGFALTLLMPTIVILSHSDEQEKKLDNSQETEDEEKQSQGISSQPHYACGSRYENITRI